LVHTSRCRTLHGRRCTPHVTTLHAPTTPKTRDIRDEMGSQEQSLTLHRSHRCVVVQSSYNESQLCVSNRTPNELPKEHLRLSVFPDHLCYIDSFNKGARCLLYLGAAPRYDLKRPQTIKRKTCQSHKFQNMYLPPRRYLKLVVKKEPITVP